MITRQPATYKSAIGVAQQATQQTIAEFSMHISDIPKLASTPDNRWSDGTVATQPPHPRVYPRSREMAANSKRTRKVMKSPSVSPITPQPHGERGGLRTNHISRSAATGTCCPFLSLGFFFQRKYCDRAHRQSLYFPTGARAPLIGGGWFIRICVSPPPMWAPGVWHQGLAEIRCPNPVRFGRNLGVEAIASASPTFLERTQVGVSSDQVGLTRCLHDPAVRPIIDVGLAPP
jgi:hypothetical protein